MRDKIFYFACLGFLLGIIFRSLFFVNLYNSLLLILISFFVLIFFIFISKRKLGVVFFVLCLSFFFGIYRFSISDIPSPQYFDSNIGNSLPFYGKIIDEPNIKENSQQVLVEVEEKDERTRILVSTNFDEEFKYGYKISLLGVLKKPENFITDQGKNFDYINYLRKDGIFYVMNFPKINIVSIDGGNFFRKILFSLKENFSEKVNRVVASPENLLLSGLILGEKSSFSKELRESFINTGTIHIVALSGYNITIVSEWIMRLFSFLPINFSILVGVLSIFLFVLMTGGGSTAIRAGIMAVLALIARATGRDYDIGRILVLTAVLMILFNPFLLVFDVSFQLSFLATIAVIFFTPRFDKYFLWMTKSFGLRDILSTTVAVYIFVSPFILYKMGSFSIVSLPANILILPFIPFTMGLGFVTGFLGLFNYILSIPTGILSYLLLHYELAVISFFSHFSFSLISFPNFPLFLTLLIYAYFSYKLFWGNIINLLSKEKI